MDYKAIIDKYYPEDSKLKKLLLKHSRCVADKALQIADRHPELNADRAFLEEAAMLHDIGITLVDAPGIHCHGTEPYIRITYECFSSSPHAIFTGIKQIFDND